MTNLEKAARQALEALERASAIMDSYAQQRQDDAITALREALEHPERDWPSGGEAEQAEQSQLADASLEPVVKPMDKAERENWYKEVIAATEDVIVEQERIAEHRALIARNNAIIAASQQPVNQEPVAWYSVKGGFNTCGEGKPLYATPVRTKDLTDDEIKKATVYYTSGWLTNARAVITADREKNK